MKTILPKSICRTKKGNFQVSVRSKITKQQVHVGVFDTIEAAIEARDKFVVENYEGLTKGYLPRGITTQKNKFHASFSFMGNQVYIGVYSDLNEAIKARDNFINSLK